MLAIDGTNISLTRGDSAYICVPILNTDGTPYEHADGDNVALQVRNAPIIGSGEDPEIIIDGKISFNQDGVPLWYISPSDSSIQARGYSWDAEIIFANGDVCTYSSGTLTILPEYTVYVAPPSTDLVGSAVVGEAQVG